MELNANREAFEKLGLGVAAISYDSTAVLHDFAQRKGIAIPLLSDAGSRIIRSVGILNDSVPHDTPFFGIPHPGVFVLDADGRVKAKYFEEDFRQRYTAGDILVHLFGWQPAAAQEEHSGRQITVTSSASNAVVSSGERIALVLDVTLKPRMHVYAPGAEGYIPIAWTMKPSPGYEAQPVELPPPQILYLPAIDEKAPVYEGHLRLIRDIVLGDDKALGTAGTLTIEGSLKYQACDDRMCYIPDTIPLKWTLEVKPHDPTRAPAALQRK